MILLKVVSGTFGLVNTLGAALCAFCPRVFRKASKQSLSLAIRVNVVSYERM